MPFTWHAEAVSRDSPAQYLLERHIVFHPRTRNLTRLDTRQQIPNTLAVLVHPSLPFPFIRHAKTCQARHVMLTPTMDR